MGNQPTYSETANDQTCDNHDHSPSSSDEILCDQKLNLAALIPLPESITITQSISVSIPGKSTPTLTLNNFPSLPSSTFTATPTLGLRNIPTYSSTLATPTLLLKNIPSYSSSLQTPTLTLLLKNTPSNTSSFSITATPPTPIKLTNIDTATSYSKISNEMIHINRMRQTKRDSIHNGIVGIFLSSKTVKIAFDFWTKNISNLNMSDELEIGCSIFFGMVSADTAIKNIFLKSTNYVNKLEIVSLKFLNMMGYLLRYLLRNDINIYSSLKWLGSLHFTVGVTVNMYDVMLTSMHETFAHYFSDEYTNEVKNAMDDVFNVVTHIMTDQDDVDDMNIEYLKSVDKCLASLDGKSALFAYLKQCGCKSIVSFHELLHKFKTASNDMERFKVARDIVRFNIDGIYGKLDISSETTQNIVVEMQQFDVLWLENTPIAMDITFFDDVEHEVNELISKRYWKAFKDNIRVLQETL